MTTAVKVNMNVCEKHTNVEVKKDEEGNFFLKISTDCECVAKLADGFNSFTLSDVVEWPKGKIFERQVAAGTTPNCLVVSGILYAARIEAGLISGRAAKKAIANSVDFVSCDDAKSV